MEKKSKFTKEQREEISKRMRGSIPWNKGIPRTEEEKRKMSESHKGQIPWNKGIPRTEEEKRKMKENNSIRGKHLSKKVRKKISKALKGRKVWNIGKPYSEEMCSKFSERNRKIPIDEQIKIWCYKRDLTLIKKINDYNRFIFKCNRCGKEFKCFLCLNGTKRKNLGKSYQGYLVYKKPYCPMCIHKGDSHIQRQCFNEKKAESPGDNWEYSCRSIINNPINGRCFEIDFVNHTKKIGYEVDGSFWHSDKNRFNKIRTSQSKLLGFKNRSDLKDHLMKEKGYKLIHIKVK